MKAICLDEQVEAIVSKPLNGGALTEQDAKTLLERVAVNSLEMSLLCGAADRLTRERFDNVGEVFAQVGINYAHCSLECDFCVLKSVTTDAEMSREEAVARAKAFVDEGANAVSLMVTADYPFEKYLETGRATRAVLPSDFPLAANIGDFDDEEAKALVDAGFTAVYHVIRLREGEDTKITVDERRRSIRAARAAGMDVAYCLEPIGPEHTADEIVEGIFRGKEFQPTSMATMRRVAVPGTPLADRGQITEVEQAKIEAIATLVAASWPSLLVMSAHEPSLLFLRAGANRVTAETGVNPRDTEADTTRNRGRSVAECQRMLWETAFTLRKGPSPALQGPLRN